MWSQLDIWNEMGLGLNTRRTVVSSANQGPLRVGQRSRLYTLKLVSDTISE